MASTDMEADQVLRAGWVRLYEGRALTGWAHT